MRYSPTFAVLFLAVSLVAFSQSPRSYEKDVEPIFLRECADCHGGAKPKKGLDLSRGKGYANLVGRKSNEVPELSLVEPGKLEQSYLWQKLQHTAKEGKGMPRGIFSSKKLAQEQLAVIGAWIQQGANP
ncbi:MAG: c-type cytochrome domain-containing protein [Thermoanaerobaculaceae bacterium]